MAGKAELRSAVLAARAAMDSAGRAAGDARRSAAVAGPLAGARVATYVAVGAEPVAPLPLGALLPVLLPGGELDWAVHDGHLVPGPRGLLEPAGLRLGPGALAGVDVVLVPAVAVDRRGTRLGRGGGSYDRALARTGARTVALLHDGELVDELPREDHDVPVSTCATPSLGIVDL